MGTVRESFVFYRGFAKALQKLDAETKSKMIDVICNYALDGIEPDTDDGIIGALFEAIKPQIDANNVRYENGKKGGVYGIRGGRPKTKPQENPNKTPNKPQVNPKETPSEPQTNPNKTPNVNVNDNVNVNVNENVINSVSKDTLVRIVNDFNLTCTSFPKVSTLSDTRKKHLKARLALHSEDELHTAFWKIEQSDFAKNGGWCGFDWLIKSENNLIKVLEGNYDNRDPQETPDKYEVAKAKINNMFGGQA